MGSLGDHPEETRLSIGLSLYYSIPKHPVGC